MSSDKGWVAFVTARLDEDEAAAMAARGDTSGEWTGRDNGYEDSGVVMNDRGEHVVYDEGAPNTAQAVHIGRHDPARELRRVEADRLLIDAYWDRAEWAREFRDPDTDYENITEAQRRWEEGAEAGLLAAIQFRAATWSDHPDYARMARILTAPPPP